MDKDIKNALESDRTIDITTIGRKSGQPRRIEIWFHNLDGRIFITGTPGKRAWYANMRSNPDFTFHLKGSLTADLAARAVPILEVAQRRSIIAQVTESLERLEDSEEWVASNPEEFEEWIIGSPLVEVEFL